MPPEEPKKIVLPAPKEYTVADLIKSSKETDVNILFKDGYVPVRLKWMNQRQFSLFMRAGRGDAISRQNEMTKEFTRKLVKKDGKIVEEEWKDDEFNKLPPGFLLSLQDALLRHLGIIASTEELKKIYKEQLAELNQEGGEKLPTQG